MSISLGSRAIMFGNSKCPACLAQFKMINDHYNSMGRKRNISYYDLEQFAAPYFLLNPDGSYAMPAWYLPTTSRSKSGKIHTGLIKNTKKFNQLTQRPTASPIKTTNLSRNPGGASNFGLIKTPPIGTLKRYGKNFPDGKGVNIGQSFDNKITKKWGKGVYKLRAGTLGREFGPKKFDKVYGNNYYNGLRMAVPGGDLDTLLNNNRTCNIQRNRRSKLNSPGLIYNSKNPQIVGFNNFGTQNLYGDQNLYYQMGPPYGHRGSNYLVKKDTVRRLYGGAIQRPQKRPGKVGGNLTYLTRNRKVYNPINPNLMFI